MNKDDLERIVISSIIASKQIADGSIPAKREYIAPAQQFIKEVSNFYNMPDNRETCLKDIKEYIAKPFDYQIGENAAIIQKKARFLKVRSCIYAFVAAGTLGAAIAVSGWFALGTVGFGYSALADYFKAEACEGALTMAKMEEALMQGIKKGIEEIPLGDFEKILLDNEERIKEAL